MKYSFMTFSTPQLSLAENLAWAKKFGYDGIEPRADAKHAHGVELSATPEQRKTIAKQAEDSGIALCCIATSCRFADPSIRAKQIEDAKRYVDLAADVGCWRLRVFGGDFPDDISRDQAIEGLGASLAEVGEYAATRKVRLCLETHDSWTNPKHVVKVMLRADHPQVRVNFDLWHPPRGSGIPFEQAFEQLKAWIDHTHFHDGGLRMDKLDQRTIGTGDLDLGLLLKLLKGINYTGYLSGEWINWEPGEIHLPRELAAMKKLEQKI